MATHSSILASENPMDRGAWWVPVHTVAESDTTEATQHTHVQGLENKGWKHYRDFYYFMGWLPIWVFTRVLFITQACLCITEP